MGLRADAAALGATVRWLAAGAVGAETPSTSACCCDGTSGGGDGCDGVDVCDDDGAE
jgi:hypothetical protein